MLKRFILPTHCGRILMQGSPRDRKKHFELFKGYMTNKKHKGIKKG